MPQFFCKGSPRHWLQGWVFALPLGAMIIFALYVFPPLSKTKYPLCDLISTISVSQGFTPKLWISNLKTSRILEAIRSGVNLAHSFCPGIDAQVSEKLNCHLIVKALQ